MTGGERMNLDSHGLPCQANGDCSDQLQRVGMIAIGNILNPKNKIDLPIYAALISELQPSLGIYTRYSGSPTNNVTGDQLVPIFAIGAMGYTQSILPNLTKQLIKRFGFAQNTYKDNDPTVHTTPDFILFRVLPFILRANKSLYVFTCVFDLLLVIASIFAVLQGSTTNTDDNNIIITLAVCKAKMPTPLSWLACKLYKHLRRPPGPAGALIDYHASSTGGNPEIATLWVPIVKRF